MTVRVRHQSGSRRQQRVLRGLELFFLAAGLIALGYYGSVVADTYVYQRYEEWALDQNLAGKEATAGGFIKHLVSADQPGDTETATLGADGESGEDRIQALSPERQPMTPAVAAGRPAGSATARVHPKVQDASLIGKILIPRVRVSAIVREGVDYRTLRRAVGHVPGTALPGSNGNIALAGHRDTFFTGLRGIRKDDRIELHTLNGNYEYQVDSIKIVTPKDVGVLAPTPDPYLTLVTCYPFNYVGSAPKRYIVRAKQITSKPVTVAAAAAAVTN